MVSLLFAIGLWAGISPVSALDAKRLVETVRTKENSRSALRKLTDLQGLGGTPNARYLPLGLCQGDCDTDADCLGGLVCFERGPGQAVPGCEGGDKAMSETDYCVQPSSITRSSTGEINVDSSSNNGAAVYGTSVGSSYAGGTATVASVKVISDAEKKAATSSSGGAPFFTAPVALATGALAVVPIFFGLF